MPKKKNSKLRESIEQDGSIKKKRREERAFQKKRKQGTSHRRGSLDS
jgi:hypothetical protein